MVYSPILRAELLARARDDFGSEIRQALAWLENLKRSHHSLAALL